MKIKTRLEISAILFICLVIAIGLTLSFTSQQVIEAYEEHNAFDEIVEGAFMLNILTGDYLAHQEERAKTQWHLKHDSLSNHLTGLESKNHEEQSILDKIRQNNENIKDVFSQLVANYEGQETSGEESGLREILSAQLSVKLQNMVSDASLLSEVFQERLATKMQTAKMLVATFVIVIMAVISVNSFLIINTIAKPIADLHHGVEMIRSGNLNHKVGILAKDEIGQLSRDFDHMTEELKARTEELKEYSENLETMVEDRTKELRDAQEQLVRQEKLAVLGQLAGGVGHELRNPLGAIKNAAYFLNIALEDPDPEIKETIEILGKEVETSERIINSLLDYARSKPPIVRKVDVNPVIQASLSRTTIPDQVEVQSQLDEGLPSILADPDQLAQVFGNIILNAIQAMPKGGQLTVKSETSGPKWVAVSFADTGVGMPEEALEKIFEPLFTTKAKGIGLGLAISETLIERHGGTIEVESEVGKGSIFTVKLPLGHVEGDRDE